MEMIWYIINAMICMAEAWIAINYFGSIFEQKKLKPVNFYALITLLYGTLFLINVAKIPAINLLVFTTITYACAMIFFQGEWQRKSYYTFIWVICSAGTEFIVLYALSVLTTHQPSGVLNANLAAYFGMILSKLILFALLKFIVKFFVKDRQEISTKQLLSYLLLPCLSLLLMLESFYLTMDLVLDDFRKIMLFATVMGIVFVNFLVFDIFEKALRAERQEKEAAVLIQEKLESEKQALETGQMLMMAEQENKLIKEKCDAKEEVIHEVKRHLTMIEGFAQAEGNWQITNYLNDYCERLQVSQEDLTPLTGYRSFNVMLNNARLRSQELGIDFQVTYNPIELGHFSDLDIGVILGNVFDNALESCQRSQEKWIKIEVGNRNSNINTIMVTNACSQATEGTDGGFLTYKEGDDHGIGLKNIEKTVNRIFGKVDFVYLAEDASFTTTIILPTFSSWEVTRSAKALDQEKKTKRGSTLGLKESESDKTSLRL